MDNSFQFIDIIFFAMIAIFLILRLRGVLGKRDGDERSGFLDLFKQDFNIDNSKENETDNLVKLTKEETENKNISNTKNDGDTTKTKKSDSNYDANEELDNEVEQIRIHDANFDKEDFLVGAHVAFEMILKAFALGDVDELKILVSNEVYGNFAKAIQDREQEGHVMEDTLVGIMKSEMVEAYMVGDVAHVTIKFNSEQINAVRDENGEVIKGNASAVLKVTDFWTFARETKNSDPNWLLVATRSLE